MTKIRLTNQSPLTVVVTLEGFATAPLGCYGCSWNETPTIDELAARGIVWDRWTAATDDGTRMATAWIASVAQLRHELDMLGGARLITTDEDPEFLAAAESFDVITHVTPSSTARPAQRAEETSFASLVAAALDQLERETDLLWIHSTLLRDLWDAPIEPANSDGEPNQVESDSAEDDTRTERFELPGITQVPQYHCQADDDPDLLFAWMTRYGAQVSLIDEMLGVFLDSIRPRRAQVVLAGTSGFSLGQNGWIGHGLGPLRSAEIRLPLLVSQRGPLRMQGLTSTAKFPVVLRSVLERQSPVTPEDWLHQNSEFSPAIVTESARAQRAITTAKWFCVSDEVDQARLFLKPDDVDDVNDVSRLERDILDKMLTLNV